MVQQEPCDGANMPVVSTAVSARGCAARPDPGWDVRVGTVLAVSRSRAADIWIMYVPLLRLDLV